MGSYEQDQTKLQQNNGWGYADTKFFVNDDGNVELTETGTVRSSIRIVSCQRFGHGWKIMSVDLAYLSLARDIDPTLPDPLITTIFGIYIRYEML